MDRERAVDPYPIETTDRDTALRRGNGAGEREEEKEKRTDHPT